MVLEGGRSVPGRRRLRHPELHAVQRSLVATRRLLGVRDAAPGGHEVELAGPDDLLGAEAVPVQDLAVEQPGDRLEPDVGMRPDVEPVPRP